jgi:hypothetical protein
MRAAVLLFLAVVAVGCRKEKTPDATGGGPPVERNVALDALAKAQCQHLYTCGKVAGGEKYETLDACRATERHALEDDLECGNFAKTTLDACVLAYGEKKCDPFVRKTPEACKALCP